LAEEIAEEIRKEVTDNRLVIDKNLNLLLSDLIGRLKKDDVLLIMGSHYIAPILFPFFNIFI